MSNIYLNEEHLLLEKMVRDFSNQELKPIAQEIDKYSKFPKDSIKKILVVAKYFRTLNIEI